MRFRAASSHARTTASVPAVRDDDARPAGAPPPPAPEPASEPRSRREWLFEREGRWGRIAVAGLFLLILAAGLVLRLRNNSYGLPYVYNFDEYQHFVSHSVNMFGGDLNPGYYQNPSGYTYLMFVALKLVYGILGFPLRYGHVSQQFATDPTPIWEFARTFTALLAMAGVVGTFFLGRRFWGARVGLIAAALLTFAFLPVVYSRIAVTDVGTFLPVAIALYAALRVYEDGRLVHYLLAGVGIGVAMGFKYTAGLVLLPLLVAAAARIRRDKGTPWLRRRDLLYVILATVVFAASFAITTPFFFLHPAEAIYQLKQQARAAGEIEKLGQDQQGGFVYYFNSFGWGLGWAVLAAAAIGAVIEVRRDRVRGLMLLIFPVALYVYMSSQTRYFGRWLLMMYPVLAILAGVAVVWVAAHVRGRHAWALSGVAAAVLTVAILIQPLAADVRTSNVLGRQDTRRFARDWLVAHYPDRLRIVAEPAVQDDYLKKPGGHQNGRRQFVTGFIRDLQRQQAIQAPLGADTTYAASLRASNIDEYRKAGFCLVMTNSLTRGRAENARVPNALAYYQRLERESTLLFHATPFKPGRKPVPLNFDLSYNYYPTAYYRPGGIVDIYRLDNCRQQVGQVPLRPYGVSGLQKGVGASYGPGGFQP
jgi:4-amino-4-deoxy-L-arabinose transferase-like glycosyltransferase